MLVDCGLNGLEVILRIHSKKTFFCGFPMGYNLSWCYDGNLAWLGQCGSGNKRALENTLPLCYVLHFISSPKVPTHFRAPTHVLPSRA